MGGIPKRMRIDIVRVRCSEVTDTLGKQATSADMTVDAVLRGVYTLINCE